MTTAIAQGAIVAPGVVADIPLQFTPAQIASLGPNRGWVTVQRPNPVYHLNDSYGNEVNANLWGVPTLPVDIAPSWFTNAQWADSNQGYTSNANPVPVRKTMLPNGLVAYIVAPMWELNEGQQGLTITQAKALKGVPLKGDSVHRSNNGTSIWTDSVGYLFAYNPKAFIATGLASGAYAPGENVGKQNWMDAIYSVGFLTVFVGGAIALGADVGFAGTDAGIAAGADAAASGATGGIDAEAVISQGALIGGDTAAESITTAAAGIDLGADIPASIAAPSIAQSGIAGGLYDVAPGALAVTTDAPVVTGGISQAGILSSIPSSLIPSTDVLAKTGLGLLLSAGTKALAGKPKPKAMTAGYAPAASGFSGVTLALLGGVALILLVVLIKA